MAFADVVMTGRTHLQDATPITLGQVISGWQAQLDAAIDGIRAACRACTSSRSAAPPSAPASTPTPNFGATVAEFIALETEKPFITAPNKFAALSAHDAVVAASGRLRTLPVRR